MLWIVPFKVTRGSIPEIDGFPEWIVTCETGQSERKENVVRLARVERPTVEGELIREHEFILVSVGARVCSCRGRGFCVDYIWHLK